LDARDEAIAALVAIERGEIRALKFGCASSVDRALFHEACKIHKELVPSCPVRAAHGDTVQLVEEIISNEIDVAIVTLPVNDLRLHPNLLNSRFGYVAMSRASHEATLFTNDMTKLTPKLSTDVSKSSAIEISRTPSVVRGIGMDV
jgi:DNA-binding transcriptional LysR family regulator